MSTTNLFSQFKRLIPASPLQSGVVQSSAGGAVVVQLPGGSELTLRGSGTVGHRVFFRNGNVESEAPNLTEVDIDV